MKTDKMLSINDEEVLLFTNPDYSSALIGISTNNRAIYDYNKMIEFLVLHENMTEEEALDFIGYNTIRSLPYAGENSPIVMMEIEDGVLI